MTEEIILNGQPELIPHSDAEEDNEFDLTAAQLLLKFPQLAPPKYVPEECRKMNESKRYNGARFEREHPEACRWVIKCLAANMGFRAIERLGGPKYYVVRAIAANHRFDVAKEKLNAARNHFIA